MSLWSFINVNSWYKIRELNSHEGLKLSLAQITLQAQADYLKICVWGFKENWGEKDS